MMGMGIKEQAPAGGVLVLQHCTAHGSAFEDCLDELVLL